MKHDLTLRLLIPFLVLESLITSATCARSTSETNSSPDFSRSDRSLNWASVINRNDATASNSKVFPPPTQAGPRLRNQYAPKQNKLHSRPQQYTPRGTIPRTNKPPGKYEYVKTGYGQPYYKAGENPIVSGVNSQVPSDQLQKRALDLIYHRFVEPRIHKHIEPRPSLIEDLMKTFDNHVRKDISAWNNASRKTKDSQSKVVPSESQTNFRVAIPSKPTLKPKPVPQNEIPISSVAHVEEGETDDTFVVTDDAGVTHLITVDEIINSLAQMDENEITELLLGKPPQSNIERADTNVNPIYQSVPKPKILPSLIPEDIQYSRKGTDDNDIVLIRSADGDTRLVTVKDLKAAEEKKIKKLGIISENIPTDQVKSITANTVKSTKVSSSKGAPFLTIEDILHLQHPQASTSLQKQKTKSHKNIFNLETQNSHQVIPQNDLPISNIKSNSDAAKPDGLENIRESLVHVRQQQQQQKQQHPETQKRPPQEQRNKRKPQLQQIQQNVYSPPPKIDSSSFSFPLPTSPLLSGVSAPNSPPLKVINTDASIMDFLPYQNTVSIGKNAPPINQKSGIRNRLSKFFSRFIRKSRQGATEPEEEEDQFVQIVMPSRSDSHVMEQITIPLPKPIHFNGRHILPSKSAQRRSDIIPSSAQRRSSSIHLSSSTDQDTSHERASDKNYQNMKVGTSTAELILKTAKIPESVKQNILNQINNKPEEFVLPSERHTQSKAPQDRAQIDRIFQVFNKAKKKDIEFPTSYVYEIPPPFEYPEPNYYAPHPPYEEKYTKKQKEKKKKKKHEDDDHKPPLVDVNLLADIVYLSKFGDDNESFAFPKVGDSSRFVDVRRNHYA